MASTVIANGSSLYARVYDAITRATQSIASPAHNIRVKRGTAVHEWSPTRPSQAAMGRCRMVQAALKFDYVVDQTTDQVTTSITRPEQPTKSEDGRNFRGITLPGGIEAPTAELPTEIDDLVAIGVFRMGAFVKS